jgi:hypothetical protein
MGKNNISTIAKLIKTSKDYYHLVIEKSNYYYGHTSPEFCELQNKDGSYTHKLSLKNCDEIFGVVNVEKLIDDILIPRSANTFPAARAVCKEMFNKAMELNKDKVFTLEDVKKVIKLSREKDDYKFDGKDCEYKFQDKEIIQSLQQPTEIEVMIEMEKVVDETKVIGAVKGVKGSGDKITTYKSVPKLDENGCLILKRI